MGIYSYAYVANQEQLQYLSLLEKNHRSTCTCCDLMKINNGSRLEYYERTPTGCQVMNVWSKRHLQAMMTHSLNWCGDIKQKYSGWLHGCQGDNDELDNICQEAFIKAYNNLQKFRGMLLLSIGSRRLRSMPATICCESKAASVIMCLWTVWISR